MVFNEDPNFKRILNKFEKLIKKSERKWRQEWKKTKAWSKSIMQIMRKITDAKKYKVVKKIQALAKAMKYLERQIQILIRSLHEDCIKECKVESEFRITFTNEQIRGNPTRV